MPARALIYGATGYIGGLTSKVAAEAGLEPALGGRDPAAVEALARDRGLEAVSFGLDGAAAALREFDVVLNCAGAFAATARPLAEACVEAGCHYLDLAGETPEHEAVAELGERARAAGVMLMPGVGFGIVPTECLAAHVAARLPGATGLKIAFETIGGASRGTLATVLGGLTSPGHVRAGGELVPARAGERTLELDLGNGERTAVLNPWRADLSAAWRSTGIGEIECYIVFPGPLRLAVTSARPLASVLASTPVRALTRRLPAGPSDKQLAAGSTHCWAQATDASGATAVSRLAGPEAYLFTARAAVEVMRRVQAGDAPPGYTTPASAYGADLVLAVDGVDGFEDLS